MWMLHTVTVEHTPRTKTEYDFKYELDTKDLRLVRVTNWSRRSKVSNRWTGDVVPERLQGADTPIFQQARQEIEAKLIR